MIKFVTTPKTQKKILTHITLLGDYLDYQQDFVVNEFKLRDHVVELSYDHCNTIQNHVSSLLYEIS
jgi:hypothetical protein